MTNQRIFGRRIEDVACSLLLRNGLSLIQRNYHCRFGEIDLIMKDVTTLVFVEVRFRKNNAFGSAAESIDHGKRRRIVFAAHYYLQRHNYSGDVRFDAVCCSANTEPEWITGAFTND